MRIVSWKSAIGISSLQRQGLQGRGIVGGLIDSGVSPEPGLQEAVLESHRLDALIASNPDIEGHGTAMAGLMVGNGAKSRERKYSGAAPQGKLISFGVCNNPLAFNTGIEETLVKNIYWLLNQRESYPIRVLNISAGIETCQNSAPPDEASLNKAVNDACKAGLIVVTSSGNDGPQEDTIKDPPATASLAITVGGSDHRDPERPVLWEFSSRGAQGMQKPELLAPSRDLVTLMAKGSHMYQQNKIVRIVRAASPENFHARLSEDRKFRSAIQRFLYPEPLPGEKFSKKEAYDYICNILPSSRIINKHYVEIEGTSGSSAIVAGGIMLLLGWAKENKMKICSAEMKRLLIETADSLPDAALSSQAGVVNFEKALLKLQNQQRFIPVTVHP